MDFSGYTAAQKISALVRGIEGDKRWNTALAKAPTADAMLDLLESASNKLKLGLSLPCGTGCGSKKTNHCSRLAMSCRATASSRAA